MSFLSKALKAPFKLHKKVAKTVVGAHKSVAKAVIKSGALAPGIAGKLIARETGRRVLGGGGKGGGGGGRASGGGGRASGGGGRAGGGGTYRVY